MAEAAKAAPKPTNPPKPVAKAGEPVVEERVDYKLTTGDVVVRTKDGVPIPNDPNNSDRVAYEAWGIAGGVAYPADVPPSVAPPTVVPAPPAAGPKDAAHTAPKEMQSTPRSTTVRE
jgi:hypothetical protein